MPITQHAVEIPYDALVVGQDNNFCDTFGIFLQDTTEMLIIPQSVDP